MQPTRKVSSKYRLPPPGVKTEWVWDEEAGELESICRGNPRGVPEGVRNSNQDTNWERLIPQGQASAQASFGGKVPAGTTVELSDVKRVAVDCISSDLIRRMSQEAVAHFDLFYQSKEADNFLCCLLRYMNIFFTLEQKGRGEGGMGVLGRANLTEAASTTDHQMELSRWRRALGEAYCRIILGQGLEEQHHMCCGRSRSSRTRSDQEFFEVFYEFVMSVVWVTFYRRSWPSIHKEVGRLLKTLPFNREVIPEELGEAGSKMSQHIEKTRSKSYGVGALKSLRSPMMISVLPTPKESASWAFRSPHLPPPRPHTTDSAVNGGQYKERVEQRNGVEELCTGIIGTPMDHYNKWTLLPLEDQDDDTDNSTVS